MKEIDISSLRKKNIEEKKGRGSTSFSWSDLLTKEISFQSQSLNNKVKEKFYSEFNTLLSAGIDFRTALEIMENDYTSKKIKSIFIELRKNVVNGKSLSTSMENSGHFTPFEFNSMAIGEETGRLQDQLKELAVFFAQKLKQKRQIVSALTYPAIVLSVAMGAIVFMLNYLVPMFDDIFKRFGGNLPAITQAIIFASDWVGRYLIYILVFFISIVFFAWSQKKKVYYKKTVSFILLKTPFIGKLILRIHLAQFSNSMQLLLNSSIPLVKALDLTQKMISFYPIQITINPIQKDIVQGMPLHVCLKKYSIYPAKMVSIIKVAEETNTLGMSFQRMMKQYQEEVQHQTSMINTALEPVIIVVLGLVIAIILIGMYLPLFQVNTLMNV
jgi:type IV pilus assembly protein PilC